MSSSFWGRKTQLARLEGLLDKADPDNVSIVAPRGMGKTTLLREVARRYAPGRKIFVTACYVDLKHRRPDLPHPVFGPLAEAMQKALQSLGVANHFSILADDIEPASPHVYTMLRRIAVDNLADDGRAVLVVLDGCDEVLKTAIAHRDVWDGLRDLEQGRGIRFVTGSRRRLVELCRDDDASTSDFFELFKARIDLLGFGSNEWKEILGANSIEGVAGAETECHNWTAGHPALARSLIDTLNAPGRVSPADVNAGGAALVREPADAVIAIWQDIGPAGRADLAEMARAGLTATAASGKRLDVLRSHGLVRQEGTAVVCGSRAVEQYALANGAAATDIQRLFSTREAFRSNIHHVLDFRQGQLPIIDKDLRVYLQRLLGDVEHAALCLGGFRGLANRALDIVFEFECPGKQFPVRWVDAWRAVNNPRWPGRGFPSGERGRQCQLLCEIVDDSKCPRLARKVTRRSAALIDQIKSYGDLGQHLDDSVDGTIAVAACFAAIEMCESVTRDLR